MNIRPIYPWAVLIMSVSLSSCATPTPKKILDSGSSAVFGPGWQCMLVPSSFDGPGTIFSVDKGGVKYHLVDLSSQPEVAVSTSPAAMGEYRETETLGTNIILDLLDKAIPGARASLSADAGHTRTTDIEYSNLTYEVTYQTATDFAEKWFNQNIRPDNGTRYYFVREAYSAGAVKYDLSDNDVASLGGEAQVRNLLSGKGTLVNAKDSSSYQLTQDFSPKLRTCILPYEFEIVSAGADGSVRWGLSREPSIVPKIISEK